MAKTWVKRSLWAGGLAVLLAGAYVAYLFLKPHRTAADDEPVASLTATSLFAAFEANEAQANARFLDKVVEVTGTVAEVLPPQQGQTRLILEAGNDLFGVSLNLLPEQDVKIPKAGQAVRARGICSGMLDDVILDQAILLP